MNWLVGIDTMGFPFTLSIQGNKKFKTTLGGVFTITSFICFLILFFLLGVNFYKRTNPSLSMNVRVVMRFTGDVKYGFAEDVVTYGIVNSAN